jgi:hypothetical protein
VYCRESVIVSGGRRIGANAAIGASLRRRTREKNSAAVMMSLHDKQAIANNKTISSPAVAWYLALPFGLGPLPSIAGPSDLTVSVSKNSEDYTLISVLASIAAEKFTLKAQSVPLLKEIADGKAKISLDPSFKLMTQTEKALLDSSYTISDFDLTMTFPTKYQEDQVIFRPFDFQSSDGGRIYQLSIGAYTKNRRAANVQDIWIAFPSPIKSSVDAYKIFLSLLAGFASIGLSWQTLKEALKKQNRGKWYIAGWLSAALLVALIYFFYVSPQGADLIGWAAGLLVPSMVAIFGALYLFIAARFQATIRGQVLVDGRVAKFVVVKLKRIEGNDVQRDVGTVESVGPVGDYEFGIWFKGPPATFRLMATYDFGGKEIEKISDTVEVARGATKDAPTLNLVLPPPATSN